MTEIEVVVDAEVFDRLAAELPKRAAAAVAKAAFVCQNQAMANAPVDTGALKNSVQARVFGVAGPPPLRRDRQGGKTGELRLATGIPTSEDPHTSYCVVGVEYGEPVERRSKFMARAAQRAEGWLTAELERAL